MLNNWIKSTIICSLMLLGTACHTSAKDIQAMSSPTVIPLPQKITQQDGQFKLNTRTIVIARGNAKAEAKTLAAMLRPATGLPLRVVEKGNTYGNSITLSLNPTLTNLGEEGYTLIVKPTGVVIEAFKPAGLFYGGQTVRQLLPPAVYADSKQANVDWIMPCVTIEDQPRFKWRGMMLDVSRHFMDADYIKKYIDVLAIHKINIFHWHLTDDDGWRVEIKKYPKLTSIGAWRGPNELLPPSRGSGDKRYGGFYTQEQIREIVAYAKQRHIDILPEIDLPGHALAIVAAYPETLPSVFGESKSVQGVKGNVISPAKEKNYQMIDDIFKELATLFPFEYVHIGGDEVNHKLWKECPQVKQLMKNENLKSLGQVQQYFTHRVEKILKKHNKKIIGWNEILHGGKLSKETAVMSWISTRPGIGAARNGYNVVMTPGPFVYFDMKYPGPKERGHWWAGIVSTEKTYSFNPIGFTELNEQQRKKILGTQACLWTEYVDDGNRADYMTYPRLTALCEVAWTNQKLRSWNGFKERLGQHLQRLTHRQVQFRIPMPKATAKDGMITVIPPYAGAEVRFTLDGSEPTAKSPRYTTAIKTDQIDQFRARTFLNDKPSNLLIGAQRLGFVNWTPKIVSTEFKPVQFDATKEINQAGNWKLAFRFTGGRHKLIIRSVRLMQNGKEITRDEHEGQAGGRHTRNVYSLPIRQHIPNAKYTIIADLRSDGGTKSTGTLILTRSDKLEPKVTVKTNIPHYSNHKVANLADWDGSSFFWSSRSVKKDEHVTWTFDAPVKCKYIESRTGKLDNPNADLLTDAILEISTDGKTFKKIAEYQFGTAKATLRNISIKAARIRILDDHEKDWLVVQDLILK